LTFGKRGIGLGEDPKLYVPGPLAVVAFFFANGVLRHAWLLRFLGSFDRCPPLLGGGDNRLSTGRTQLSLLGLGGYGLQRLGDLLEFGVSRPLSESHLPSNGSAPFLPGLGDIGRSGWRWAATVQLLFDFCNSSVDALLLGLVSFQGGGEYVGGKSHLGHVS
jgi:hypothetical protein